MNTLLMTPEQICDELTYINYCANRDVGPKALRAFFGNATDALEARYRREGARTEPIIVTLA